MKKKKYFIITLTILLLVTVFAVIGLNAFADVDKDKICKGVYINAVDVSNMTAVQAEAAVNEYITTLKTKQIVIDVDGEKVTTTVGDLGFDVETHDYIDEALAVGKSGNLIKRYKELKDIERENLVFELVFKLDDTKLNEFISTSEKFNIEPKNSTLSRVNGVFTATESVDGRVINSDKTKEAVKTAILNGWNGEDILISAHLEEKKAEYTKDMVLKCNALLGSFSTTYRDSSSSRSSNLANGAKKINGSIVYPGETWSAYAVLSPFTIANGWSSAGAYLNGMVVDSIGGGVCQVSTTLYNALLRAEVEIVERAPHSMIVSYVEPAMDAAIAGTYKDLKFKNNTDAPIYIESYTKGRSITFNIYGNETRPSNRTVKYVSEVLEKKDPPAEVITEDPTKDTTYRKVTQSAHYGYKANLWKVVYVNGKEVSREKVNYSTYRAAPAYVTVGTKVEPTPTPTPKPGDETKPGTGDKGEGETKPGAGDKEEGATKPGTGDKEEGATKPGTGDKEEGATKPGTGDKEEGVTKPGTGDKEEGVTKPGTGDKEEGVTKPKTDEQSKE